MSSLTSGVFRGRLGQGARRSSREEILGHSGPPSLVRSRLETVVVVVATGGWVWATVPVGIEEYHVVGPYWEEQVLRTNRTTPHHNTIQ